MTDAEQYWAPVRDDDSEDYKAWRAAVEAEPVTAAEFGA